MNRTYVQEWRGENSFGTWRRRTLLLMLAVANLHPVLLQAVVGDTSTSLRVAAVQMRSSPSLSDNVSRITNWIRECASQGARVVAFSECALTSYSENVVNLLSAVEIQDAARQVAEACRKSGIHCVLGSAWYDGDRLLDSALIIGPTGGTIVRYDKIQLAERWPQAGDQLFVFEVDRVPCSVIICHDERYPELVRLPVLAGARVIFYISHESGVREESKMGPYRAQIQARAVENTVFVVQANAPANADASGSHGQSRVVAPDGNVVEEASIFDQDVVIANLDLSKATRNNTMKSLTRGPFRDWWKEGMQRVRVIK